MTGDLSFNAELSGSREDVVDRVIEALKNEGFGVLTRIDVDSVLKEKLGVDARPLTILGACNPGLAHKAISARPDVALLLPCNVTIEETAAGACLVRIADPETMMGVGDLADAEGIVEVGAEAAARLKKAADALRAGA